MNATLNDRIIHAPAVPASKNTVTKDVLNGRLLTALVIIHELESALEAKQATIRALNTRIDDLNLELNEEQALQDQNDWNALRLENQQLKAANKRLNRACYAQAAVRAKAERRLAEAKRPSLSLEERRERMAAAREEAMATGQTSRAF